MQFNKYRNKQPRAASDLKAEITGILARQPQLGSVPIVRAQFHKLDHAEPKDLESLLLELKFLEEQAKVEDSTDDQEE
jgi:hypothetical protein